MQRIKGTIRGLVLMAGGSNSRGQMYLPGQQDEVFLLTDFRELGRASLWPIHNLRLGHTYQASGAIW